MTKYSDKSESLFHKLTRDFQVELMHSHLIKNNGNVFKTAKELGISRGTFYKLYFSPLNHYLEE